MLQKSTTAESVQPCVEILSNLEKLEKLAESVNVWAEGAEQVLTTTHPQEIPEESVMSTIQVNPSYSKNQCIAELLEDLVIFFALLLIILLIHKLICNFKEDYGIRLKI